METKNQESVKSYTTNNSIMYVNTSKEGNKTLFEDVKENLPCTIRGCCDYIRKSLFVTKGYYFVPKTQIIPTIRSLMGKIDNSGKYIDFANDIGESSIRYGKLDINLTTDEQYDKIIDLMTSPPFNANVQRVTLPISKLEITDNFMPKNRHIVDVNNFYVFKIDVSDYTYPNSVSFVSVFYFLRFFTRLHKEGTDLFFHLYEKYGDLALAYSAVNNALPTTYAGISNWGKYANSEVPFHSIKYMKEGELEKLLNTGVPNPENTRWCINRDNIFLKRPSFNMEYSQESYLKRQNEIKKFRLKFGYTPNGTDEQYSQYMENCRLFFTSFMYSLSQAELEYFLGHTEEEKLWSVYFKKLDQKLSNFISTYEKN